MSRSSSSTTMVGNFSAVLERSLNPFDDKTLRVPFYLDSTYRQKLGVKGVSMMVNPTSVSFSQAKRTTRKDTQGGSVFYHWTNRMGRNNDVLEMNFSGQTGNINIRTGTLTTGAAAMIPGSRGPIDWMNNLAAKATTSTGDAPASVKQQGNDYSVSGAAKLACFWNLYALTREPNVDPQNGAPVYYYIAYNSPVFGNTYVTFIGHFNKVLDFTDDATNPFNKLYTFSFTALASVPSMDYIYAVVSDNLRTVFMNPL